VYFWSYSFTWPVIALAALHALVMLLALVFFGLLPTAIAFVRKHHNRFAILALNVMLGWTIIGWAVALVWSLTAVWRRPSPTYET
jgi:Superinfection immunity protein